MSEPELQEKKENDVIDELPMEPAPTPVGEAGAAGSAAADIPTEAKPGILKRTGTWLFNPESKVGRFNRSFVRGLGWFAVCFLVGFLVAFLVLYQPENQALKQANETITEQQSNLENVSAQLETANDEIGRLQQDLALLQADLDTQTLRGGLTAALSHVNAARVALLERDGVAAKEALQAAAAELTEVQPQLEALDPQAAESVLARLSLADNELARNPETAKQDLQILSGDLAQIAAGLY